MHASDRPSTLLSPDDCAVVVIDMHKGHIGPGATIPVDSADSIIVPLLEFLDEVRARHIPVIHVRYEAVEGVHNEHPTWLAKAWPREHALADSPTAEFVVSPKEGDYVIEHKRTYNCFAHTDLDLYMRRLRRNTVVIAGLTSDCCCLATAFGACDLHYAVVAISDCQAATDPGSHRSALRIVDDVLGRAMTSHEFLRSIVHA